MAVFAVAKLHGIEMTPQLFRGVQILEYDTLEERQQTRKQET